MQQRKLYMGVSIAVFLAVGTYLFMQTSLPKKQKEIIVKKEFKECSNSYNLNYSTDMIISDSAYGVQKIVSDLNGTLDFRIFEIGKEYIKIGFYINPSNHTINKKEQYDKATNELYNHIVLVKMDKLGKFIDYELPTSIHPDDENILLSLILPLQWNLHKDGKIVYKNQEVDTVGVFEADYNGTKKLKQSYSKKSVQVHSSFMFSDILKNDCWHKNSSIRESIAYEKTKSHPELKTNVRYDISYISTLSLDHPLMKIDDYNKLWEQYKKPTTAIRSVQERYTNFSQFAQMKIAKLNLKDIISKLVEGSKHELEDQLLAYLLSDPKALDEIIKGIKGDIYNEYQMGIILRVMGKMNTPKAQIALSEVMIGDYTLNDRYRFWAALELGKQTTRVPDIVKERLFEQLDYSELESESQLRISAAIYSLGSISNNLNEKDENYAKEINDRLISLLNATSDNEDIKKAYLLGALGNTRSPEMLDLGKEYILDKDTDLRKRAVIIIANNDSSDATITLEEKLLTEADSLVKSTILNSLSLRPPEQSKDIRKEVIQMANSKESEIVRTSAINYLVNQLPPTQENKKVFVGLLEKETLMENVEKLVFKVKSIK